MGATAGRAAFVCTAARSENGQCCKHHNLEKGTGADGFNLQLNAQNTIHPTMHPYIWRQLRQRGAAAQDAPAKV